MDVSDGLAQDLGHLCRAGGCGAEIMVGDVPLSPAARTALTADPSLIAAILSGGDDYELCFTAARIFARLACVVRSIRQLADY